MNKIKHIAMLFTLLFTSTTGVFAQFSIQKALRYDYLSERPYDRVPLYLRYLHLL